jgi:hypothetical protein
MSMDADILETRIALAKERLRAHWGADAWPLDDPRRRVLAYAAFEVLAGMGCSDAWHEFLQDALAEVQERSA